MGTWLHQCFLICKLQMMVKEPTSEDACEAYIMSGTKMLSKCLSHNDKQQGTFTTGSEQTPFTFMTILGTG